MYCFKLYMFFLLKLSVHILKVLITMIIIITLNKRIKEHSVQKTDDILINFLFMEPHVVMLNSELQ